MSKNSGISVLGWMLAIAIVFCAALIGYGQQPDFQKQQDERAAKLESNIDGNGDAIADFNAAESSDAKEREIRRKRNRNFNVKVPDLPDATFVQLQEKDAYSIYYWTARPRPAFPTKSNFVAIGTVTSAEAFVSEDKTDVYNEFNFQISRILKNTTSLLVQGKSEIPLVRSGGKVRFPSGKIIYRMADGLYMPKAGNEYLMFLNYDTEKEAYEILTGYQIKNAKVEALDGLSLLGDRLIEQFRNYPKYNGTEVNEFINLVAGSIAQTDKSK